MSYLRRFPHMQTVPIVFVTSDDKPETIGSVRKTRAWLIIIKPATIDPLKVAHKETGLIR